MNTRTLEQRVEVLETKIEAVLESGAKTINWRSELEKRVGALEKWASTPAGPWNSATEAVLAEVETPALTIADTKVILTAVEMLETLHDLPALARDTVAAVQDVLLDLTRGAR